MKTKKLGCLGTRLDYIRNEDIRDRHEIAPIVENSRPRWHGHVIRAKENSLAKIGLNIEVDVKPPTGRSEQRWLDTLDGDLMVSRIHQNHF